MIDASVMVVEDEGVVALHLKEVLTRLGYHVAGTASNGPKALQSIRELRPDVVLMDIRIQGEMDGISAAAAIPTDLPVSVIYLTAYSDEPTLDRARATAPSGYLLKPFSERELHASIQMVLERRRADLTAREHARQLERAYEDVKAASRLKDEFLATMSHELRTPLNTIVGYVQMLRSGVLTPDKQVRAIEVLERNAALLTRLVNDVLDTSRFVSGRLRLDVHPVRLSPLVADAIAAVLPAADAKGVHLETAIDPDLPPIAGDAERLLQLVWNLLANAVKFTPQGGRVNVSLHAAGGHVELVVHDTGIGIRPELLSPIFEHFRQGDGSVTREYGGLGLGLGIARGIAEMHGGTIDAASEGPGRGATFTARFPTSAPVHTDNSRNPDAASG